MHPATTDPPSCSSRTPASGSASWRRCGSAGSTSCAGGRRSPSPVTEVSGRGMVWGTPKGHERRDVPIPRFLVNDLARHVAGRPADALVFTAPQGGVLRVRSFRRVALDPAAESVGIPGLHPHALRHTAASLAIASGADVKVVQQTLGHKSATHDPRPVWPPVRRPPRRCGRRDGRGTHRGASPCCPLVPTTAVIELDTVRQVAIFQQVRAV